MPSLLLQRGGTFAQIFPLAVTFKWGARLALGCPGVRCGRGGGGRTGTLRGGEGGGRCVARAPLGSRGADGVNGLVHRVAGGSGALW